MICKNCNAEIDDNSKFCTECGSAIVLNNKIENEKYIEVEIKTIDEDLKDKNEENQNINRQMNFNESNPPRNFLIDTEYIKIFRKQFQVRKEKVIREEFCHKYLSKRKPKMRTEIA